MFKNRQQLLIRFLKNYRIYHLLLNDGRFHSTKQRISNGYIDINFFDASLSWVHTNEGHDFWLKMQCEFILFVIENDKNNCFGKNKVKEYFHRIIHSGYFASIEKSERLNKGCKYYFDLIDKYKKYIETF